MMINTSRFFLYLAVMAGVTYLIRMLPLVLCRRKITNRFLKAFLYYIPYTVLGAMTFPAILYSTASVVSAAAGLLCAVFLSCFERGLLCVAAVSCAVVLAVELVLPLL